MENDNLEEEMWWVWLGGFTKLGKGMRNVKNRNLGVWRNGGYIYNKKGVGKGRYVVGEL